MKTLAGRAWLVALVALLVAMPSGLAQEITDPTGQACVAGEEDAECRSLAVSATGNATCRPFIAACLAASGTGDARACEFLCAAVAPVGNATADHPVSVTGECRDDPGQTYRACLAASLEEEARGHYAALSGTGDADCRRKECAAASLTGDASGNRLALTGTGDATASVPLSLTGGCREHATEADEPCFDVAMSDDAAGYHAGVSATGDASGCVAASGQGAAESGCHELFEVGDAECTPHPPIRITERV